jgi:hypothetical protein
MDRHLHRSAGCRARHAGGAVMNAPRKRRGRGKGKATLELIETARRVLAEIQPATVRAVCYRLFVLKAIPNMSANSTQKVSKQLVWARENGVVPWEWIVDETRSPEHPATWDNPSQVISQVVKTYRRDYWQHQPRFIEVWSEKGTVRGTLGPVLDEYGVTFRVMHGFGSATVVHDVAEEARYRYERDGRILEILYVGDYDPSGLYMSEMDLPERMNRYDGEAIIERVALTREDCTDLPSFEANSKRTDPRWRWFTRTHGGTCWELDAMSPVDLRARVEQAIRDRIDTDAWDHAVMVEQAETESMQLVLQAWKSISRQIRKKSRVAGEAAP